MRIIGAEYNFILGNCLSYNILQNISCFQFKWSLMANSWQRFWNGFSHMKMFEILQKMLVIQCLCWVWLTLSQHWLIMSGNEWLTQPILTCITPMKIMYLVTYPCPFATMLVTGSPRYHESTNPTKNFHPVYLKVQCSIKFYENSTYFVKKKQLQKGVGFHQPLCWGHIVLNTARIFIEENTTVKPLV